MRPFRLFRLFRIFRDESGVALGLAIMVVVLVGVVGAGLLVFARNDLAAVIQSNQGQRAFYAAEAGVQSAKLRLLSDALPSSYDADDEDSEFYGPDSCNVPDEDRTSEYSEESGGVTRSFADGEFTATVRWLAPGCEAPDTARPTAEYFRVVSTGTFGGATRRIEAIYRASDIGAPHANYAAGDATISADATVDGVSVFSGGDVEVEDSISLRGEDEFYGDWTTERGVSRPTRDAGVGAVGEISGDRARVGERDFDGASPPPFAGTAEAGVLTFPFDPGYWENASTLDFLKSEAEDQGNYFDSDSAFDWPEDSSEATVVYVDFGESSGTLVWDSGFCEIASECRGTLVVGGGSFEMQSGSAFGGAVVVAGGGNPDSLTATVGDGARLEGFVATSGSLKISGEISPVGAGESRVRPGFYGTELWSWRELYE